MKRLILILAVVAMILPSCGKINDAIDELDNRLDKLEQETIPSVDEQIAAINVSLDNLNAMDKELKGYIDGLTATATNLQEQINAANIKIEEVKAELKNDITSTEDELKEEIETAKANVIAQLEAAKEAMENELATINATIATLQAKDTELDNKIAELRSYVDTELGDTTDWVNATFATLEQYNALVSEVATIKEQIKAINQSITELETRLTTKINEDIANAVSTLNADIQQKVSEITSDYTNAVKTAKEEITTAYTTAIQNAINALDVSLKAWVGEQLANYYTIAEVEAKITALQTAIADGDATLQEELKSLKSQLETTATEITAAYKKAIEEAINTNNGVIDTKIANEIASVNQRITNEINTINSRLDDIESRLDALEDKVDDLMNRKLEITFEETEDIAILAGDACKVNYTITSSESEVHIATIAQNGWKASVTKSTEKTGYITVYAPNPLTSEPIIVLVSDANTTIMRSLTFVDGVTNIATKSYAITNEATTLSVNVSTNLNYTVSIPSTANGWISLENITTRATVRNDVINLNIKENTATSSRTATIQLVCNDTEVGTISIYQQGIEVANNELIYTSSDRKIIEPYQTMGFNANIISNTYSNGRGVIVFDKAITAISEYAFYDCSTLTSIKMPKSITKIREYAFYDSGLTNIEIPNNVTEIATYAFYSTNIVNLIIPDSVTSIGDSAFYDCDSLTSITIPNGVTSIGDSAFRSCTSLTSITIPDSVTSIGNYAFYYCHSLTSVTIGNGVTWIGSCAFLNCISLTSVYCKPITPPTECSLMFEYNASGRTIYVPRNSVEAYKSAEYWSEYASDIVGYDF